MSLSATPKYNMSMNNIRDSNSQSGTNVENLGVQVMCSEKISR